MSSIGLSIRIPKQSLIKLNELQNKQLVVRFSGGREVAGSLKSWDKHMNLILENTVELLGIEGEVELTRVLGLIIVHGFQSISLKEGYLIIENPYADLLPTNEKEQDKEAQEQEEDGEGEAEGEQKGEDA